MYIVSPAPHIHSGDRVSHIMTDVCIALIPTTVWGIYRYGMRAVLIICISILSCVISEYIYQKATHKDITISDMSACVSGLLLALTLPPYVPFPLIPIGAAFAMIVVKGVYGGIGKNFMNPALAARCFLLISFAGQMTRFDPDAVSSATPLALMKHGETAAASQYVPDILKAFWGFEGGCIGEESVPALLIGAAYLLVKNVIHIRIPAAYLLSFVTPIGIYAAYSGENILYFVLMHICTGGLVLGAFFMATDYVTSPMTACGQIVFGMICGVLNAVIRLFGGLPEGTSYAIICANMLVPVIDRYIIRKPFGEEIIRWRGDG